MQSSEFILLNRNWIASEEPDMNNNFSFELLNVSQTISKVFLVFKFCIWSGVHNLLIYV